METSNLVLEVALTKAGRPRRKHSVVVRGDLVAGAGAQITLSGIGTSSPIFSGCPPCARHQDKCLFPHLTILLPRVTVPGAQEHPHFTDQTVKAWRQRGFPGEQSHQDVNLACLAPCLLLSTRIWHKQELWASGFPLGIVVPLATAGTLGKICSVPRTVLGGPDLLPLSLCLHSSLP